MLFGGQLAARVTRYCTVPPTLALKVKMKRSTGPEALENATLHVAVRHARMGCASFVERDRSPHTQKNSVSESAAVELDTTGYLTISFAHGDALLFL